MIAHVSASHGDESFETKAYRMDSIAERKGHPDGLSDYFLHQPFLFILGESPERFL